MCLPPIPPQKNPVGGVLLDCCQVTPTVNNKYVRFLFQSFIFQLDKHMKLYNMNHNLMNLVNTLNPSTEHKTTYVLPGTYSLYYNEFEQVYFSFL